MLRFLRDQAGAVTVEAALMMGFLLTALLGAVDFGFAFYQWNAAAKAVQVGARIAAVSDPVSSGLRNLTADALTITTVGQPMPSFDIVCTNSSCSCIGQVCTANTLVADTNALDRIVYGRSTAKACGDAQLLYQAGMCDILPQITPANVTVRYSQTGLGYAGRPGGPVPTITVSLTGVKFRYFFLSGLLNLSDIEIKATARITGEDLSSSAPVF